MPNNYRRRFYRESGITTYNARWPGMATFDDVITSTVSTGTAPFSIASTTLVSNLNADLLDGFDWNAPGPIGAVTPASGSFTTVSITGASGGITTTQSTISLFNTVATTVNAFGAATAITIGDSASSVVTVRGGTLVGNLSTQNVFNTVATTVNAFGAATAITLGDSASSVTTIRGGTLVGNLSTQNVFNTVATTVNAFGAATAITIGDSASSVTTIRGGTLAGNLSTQNVFNTVATTVNAFGAATTITMGDTSGSLTLRNPTITLAPGTASSSFNQTGTQLEIRHTPPSGTAGLIDFNPLAPDGTSNATFRFFRLTSTTGMRNVLYYVGNGANDTAFQWVLRTAAQGGPVFTIWDGTAGGSDIKITLSGLTGDGTFAGTLGVNGGTLSTTATTFNLVNTTATTVNFAGGASTALNIGHGSAPASFAGGISIADGKNIAVQTTTGTKIGTSETQKLGFWNATPVVQPSSTGESSGWTTGLGSALTHTDTFTGNLGSKAYTINDIVKHLKTAGIIATS